MKPYKSYDTIIKILNVIEQNETGAYLRYGDGDFNIMTGKSDMYNSFNSQFSNELKESVIIDDKNYMKGFCLMCNKYGLLEEKMWGGNHEWPQNLCDNFYNILLTIRNKHLTDYYSPVAFNYYITTYPEKSFELMSRFKKLCERDNSTVIFVGNANIRHEIIKLYFNEKYDFIECPPKNSYDKINEIEKMLIDIVNKDNKYKIIIICCGVTSRCLIKRIWKNNNINRKYFLLDFGSIIDGLSGINSRQYYIETKFNVTNYNKGFKKYIS
tara:strand:- start:56 stop:862 length:807 start_codon:yes stop_codon:yes gene_type:complete